MAVRVDDALVSRLASLANLELSLDEARALTRDLGRIVEYVAILEQADVEGVEPLASVRAERERRRADVPLPSLESFARLARGSARGRRRLQGPAVRGRGLTMTPLFDGSVPELAARVARGDVSAVELATASLDAIAAKDPGLGAFLTVGRDAALEAARAIDARRARGERLGPLAGVPIAVKDALATHDAPTTAGSRILLRRVADPPDPRDGYVPPYDATVVARLRAADAVIVGKTNMDELAMGSSTRTARSSPRETRTIPRAPRAARAAAAPSRSPRG
jgi:aspartyl/glutamyl-tRNA(Asn/Gln) amidotransferase C subunit